MAKSKRKSNKDSETAVQIDNVDIVNEEKEVKEEPKKQNVDVHVVNGLTDRAYSSKKYKK